MKVLILSHLFPNELFPYEGSYIRDSLPQLQANDLDLRVGWLRDMIPNRHHLRAVTDVSLLERLRCFRDHFRYRDGENVEIVPIRYARIPGLGAHSEVMGRWIAAQARPQIRRLRESFGFEAILAYTLFPAADLAVRLKEELTVPVLAYSRGSDLHSIPGTEGARAYVRRILEGADLTFTVSHELEERAKELAPEATVQTAFSGIDLSKYSAEGPSARLGEGSHVLFILYFKSVKNPMLGMRAFARVAQRSSRKITMHVFGDGPLRGDAEQFVEEQGLADSVIFYGVRDPTTIIEYMRAATVLLLTSRREGLPRVILEAMSVGLPVVSTAVGGVPDLITDERLGYLCSEHTPEAIGSALQSALEARWDRDQIRERARRFGNERVCSDLVRTIRTVARPTPAIET